MSKKKYFSDNKSPAAEVPIPTAQELEQVWIQGRDAYMMNISAKLDILEGVRASRAGFNAVHALLTKGRGGEGV